MASEKNRIKIEINTLRPSGEIRIVPLKTLVKKVCLRFGLDNAIVGIAIVNDQAIKKVHADFLKKPDVTDVISFDLSDEQGDGRVFELVVNLDQAHRQAAVLGHSTQAEVALYITHGLLHNLGFDDSSSSKAQKMHLAEDEILQQAGFGVVYKGTAACRIRASGEGKCRKNIECNSKVKKKTGGKTLG